MSEPHVGSAGEEALRLLRALGPTAASTSPDHHDVAGVRACSTPWCPVCQVADFVRDHPEAIAGVAASAGAMLHAVRDLIDAAASPKERP